MVISDYYLFLHYRNVNRINTFLVTEREVINGILQANNPNEHCLCYVRQIKNININQTSTASKFIDIVHKQVSYTSVFIFSWTFNAKFNIKTLNCR